MRLLRKGWNGVLCVLRVLDGFCCHYSFGRSRANVLKDYSFRRSGTEGNSSIYSATAANHGKRCRCGKGHERQSCPEGLYQWCGRNGHSATAAKSGKRCRCGEKGRKGQDSDRKEVALCGKGKGTKMNRSHEDGTGWADSQSVGTRACGSVQF